MTSFSAERQAEPKVNAARESYGHVKDDLHKLKDDAVGAASATVQAAKQKAMQGVDSATEYAQQANDYAMDAYESACEYVRERPATAMLIAVGVGAVLSRLLLPTRR